MKFLSDLLEKVPFNAQSWIEQTVGEGLKNYNEEFDFLKKSDNFTRCSEQNLIGIDDDLCTRIICGTQEAKYYRSGADESRIEDKKEFCRFEALELVKDLMGYRYKFKDFPQKEVMGLIAQEAESVVPELVNGEEGTKAMSYGLMMALIVEAIKDIAFILEAGDPLDVMYTNKFNRPDWIPLKELFKGEYTFIDFREPPDFPPATPIPECYKGEIGGGDKSDPDSSEMDDALSEEDQPNQSNQPNQSKTSPLNAAEEAEMNRLIQEAAETSEEQNSTVSDRTKKKNIRPIEDSLEKVMAIEGVEFTFKETNKDSIGVIAQQIEQIIPQVVSGSEGNKRVEYGPLVGLLIEAFKEQNKRIDELEKELFKNKK